MIVARPLSTFTRSPHAPSVSRLAEQVERTRRPRAGTSRRSRRSSGSATPAHARQQPRDLVGDVRIGRSEVQVDAEPIVEDRGDVDHVPRDLDDAPLAGARLPQQHLLVRPFTASASRSGSPRSISTISAGRRRPRFSSDFMKNGKYPANSGGRAPQSGHASPVPASAMRPHPVHTNRYCATSDSRMSRLRIRLVAPASSTRAVSCVASRSRVRRSASGAVTGALGFVHELTEDRGRLMLVLALGAQAIGRRRAGRSEALELERANTARVRGGSEQLRDVEAALLDRALGGREARDGGALIERGLVTERSVEVSLHVRQPLVAHGRSSTASQRPMRPATTSNSTAAPIVDGAGAVGDLRAVEGVARARRHRPRPRRSPWPRRTSTTAPLASAAPVSGRSWRSAAR